MEISLIRASVNDAENIWEMQKNAFADLLEKYQDHDTNPGGETLEKLRWKLIQNDTYFYLIYAEGQIVGAIRVVDNKDDNGPKRISPLFVLPEHRGKGFAQAAILEAERIHGNQNWSLSTILQEKGICYLYEKMGYAPSGETQKVNDRMTLIYYEK